MAGDGAGVDRRDFLSSAAGLGVGAALLGGLAPVAGLVRPARAADRAGARRAMNLIFMVSDGMSMGTLQLADLRSRRLNGKPSNWVSLFTHAGVRRGLQETGAADSHVTDSAAAATAWGTGVIVNNGCIGLAPDGSMPVPLLVQAKQAGKATGLVTTTRLTHATPAGFIANIGSNRDDEGPIARQMLERGVDVMLGGGSAFVTEELIAARTDLRVVRDAAQLAAFDARGDVGKRLLGVFNEQHLSYEIERPQSEPSLREMTRAALARLAALPGGFVVQIEGGRVDHAAHSNDAAALLHDQGAFDDALAEVLGFVEGRDDTLLIVTSDHGNGNPGLTDYGAAGNEGFERLLGVKHSVGWMSERLGKSEPTDAMIREVVREGTGIDLLAEEAGILRRWRAGEVVDPFLAANKGGGPLASVLANHTAVAFLSPNHTSDLVEFTALGPGSELVPGWLRNADVHGLMTAALDLPPAKPM